MKTKKLLSVLLILAIVFALAACGGQSNDTTDTNGDTTATDTDDTKTDANADMIYAVETGSAGEAAAKEKGWEINSVAAQADALMEVEAGTSDAAIVDLLMATAMTGEGTSYPDLTYDAEQKLTTEEYGIGCRKGSDLAAFINNVLAETYADGSMKKVADTYKLADAMVEQAAPDASYTSRARASWSWASPSSSRWTTRTPAATGSASTPTWPSWWLRSWAWTSSSPSSTGTTRSWSWTPSPSTWSGTA